MTSVVVLGNGETIEYNNIKEPMSACMVCYATNLKHEFTGGPMSDQYSCSTCLDCEVLMGYVWGFTMAWYNKNGFSIIYRMCEDKDNVIYNEIYKVNKSKSEAHKVGYILNMSYDALDKMSIKEVFALKDIKDVWVKSIINNN